MEPLEQKSYWPSVILAGVIFGLVYFALATFSGYYQINSSATSNIFGSITGTVICLLSGVGALLATWHYQKENETELAIGKGAVIGLLTGLLIGILSVILSQLWHLVDPLFMQKLLDHQIAIINAKSNLTDDQKQKAIDMIHNMSGTMKYIQYTLNVVGVGILNLLTGMLGAKIFSKGK